MDGTGGVMDHRPLHAVHDSDVVVDLEHLAGLFRSRAASRVPVRQRDLPLLERTVRKQVAGSLLTQVMPALVSELLEAVADDLSQVEPEPPRSELEVRADDELRVVESVERCKAVLDAVGLEALARLRSTIESSELARFADLGRSKPPGWVDADELTAMEVCTATGLGTNELRARLALAAARTPGAASLRHRLQRGVVTLRRRARSRARSQRCPLTVGQASSTQSYASRTAHRRLPPSSVSD
jgi:hypothetical protein